MGETTRNLYHRISEHKGVSTRTQKQLANPSFSSIRLHSHNNSDHQFTWDDFKILRRVTDLDIKTFEALYIKDLKPELNGQSPTKQLNLF